MSTAILPLAGTFVNRRCDADSVSRQTYASWKGNGGRKSRKSRHAVTDLPSKPDIREKSCEKSLDIQDSKVIEYPTRSAGTCFLRFSRRKGAGTRRAVVASRKYARDYTLQNELDNRGHLRTTAVYSGPQFRYTRETGERLPRERLIVTAGTIICLAAVLVPLCVNAPVLRHWYTALPLAAALAACFLLAQLTVRLFLEKPPFTRRTADRLTGRLAPCSATAAALGFASAVGQVICLFRSGASVSDWPVLGGTVLLVLAGAFLFTRHGRFRAEEIPDAERLPEGTGH